MPLSVEIHARNVRDDLERIERFFAAVLVFVLGAIGLFSLSISPLDKWNDFSRSCLLSLGVSLVALVSSATVGAFLGFLFGIPKSLQRSAQIAGGIEGANGQGSNGRKFLTNTSLEEISDWLTKIIIGISLVQFERILNFVGKSSGALSQSVAYGLDSDSASFAPFFFALLVFGCVGACLFVYLETRTRLTLLLVGADTVSEHAGNIAVEAVSREVAKEGVSRSSPGSAGVAASKQDKEIARIDPGELRDPVQLAGWASAQARLQNYRAAEDALEDALARAPENVEIRMRLAEVRQLLGDYQGALDILLEGRRGAVTDSERRVMTRRGLLLSLYLPPPDGFRRALELSDELLKESSQGAKIYLWRAAAFGQSYKWLKENGGSKGALEDARAGCLQAIGEVVRRRPDPAAHERVLLRAMLRPSKADMDKGNDDLAIFSSDPEFVRAVELAA